MNGLCVASILLAAIALLWLLGIRLQLRSMRRQLEERLQEQTKTPLVLEMQDRELRALAVAVNRALEQENRLRVRQEVQEREFKELISDISHDLRTPLTVTKGYLQLLEECGMEAAGRDYLRTCLRHTNELEARIGQFFEYSVLAAREDQLPLSPLPITNLVTSVMSSFVPLFEEKGLRMRLERETAVTGLAEEQALCRVLQNIFRNCLHYGTGEMSVSVTADDKRGQVQILVKNPVAEPESLDVSQVFQRFYVGTPARGRCTGLGLSIVRHLCGQMQGSVSARLEGEQFCVEVVLKQGKA